MAPATLALAISAPAISFPSRERTVCIPRVYLEILAAARAPHFAFTECNDDAIAPLITASPPPTLFPPPFFASVLFLLLASSPSAICSVCQASRKPRCCWGPPPVYPTQRWQGGLMAEDGEIRMNAGVGSWVVQTPAREGLGEGGSCRSDCGGGGISRRRG